MSANETCWILTAGSVCAFALSLSLSCSNSSEGVSAGTPSSVGGAVTTQGSGGSVGNPATAAGGSYVTSSGGAPAALGGAQNSAGMGAGGMSVVRAGSTGSGGSAPMPNGGAGSAGVSMGGASSGGIGSGAAGARNDAGSTPPTGTFPAVQDPTAKGPYTSQTVTGTGPNNAYTIYRPTELAPMGTLNPIVSWGNGSTTTPSQYPLLPHLATHGFVVIAANSTQVTPALVTSGVDWIVAQNETMASPYYHKLDTKNVSGVGYSLGGLATYGLAGDPRVVTTVIISGANMMGSDRSSVGKLLGSIAYLCTDDSASRGNCDGDFAVVTVPAFYGVMKGTQHVDVVFNTSTQTLLSRAVTGWLRWRQMKDETQKALFAGSACGLCMDSKWSVQQKNGL